MLLTQRHMTLFFLFVFYISQMAGAEAPAFLLQATGTRVVVDGVLDEASWGDATVIPLPYEYQPGDNVSAIVSTEALVTFDHDYLYVAFRAEDPDPSKIRANLMDRDQIDTFVQDDHVVLMIDTFNDERRAFQFRVNPLGVQADAIFSETDGMEDFSWDLIWDSAGRITDFGYVVEIAISLKQLRFPRTQDIQTWGFDLSRSYPRNVRRRFSAVPKDRNSSCVLCQVAKVTGFAELESGRNVEISPTLTASRTDTLEQPGASGLSEGDTDIEFGVTGAWGVTPNITLSATVNPDFSQVEADAAQLEVNERFALFYPERRPFFLVGIDLFATPIQAAFTRTVVDPTWGLKLTGKEGRHGMGLFVTSDDVNQVLIPSNQGSAFATLDGTALTTVGRYRLDVGAGSTLGAIVTDRQGEDYHNRVGGIDGFFRLSRSNIFRFQALTSNTKYPAAVNTAYGQDQDSFSGYVVNATFQHASRNWFAMARYVDYDPGFRADAGFVPRVDLRTVTAVAQRTSWGEPDDWYTAFNFGAMLSRSNDHDGELTDEFYRLFGNLRGPWQSQIGIDVIRVGELVEGVYYSGLDQIGANFDVQPNGNLRFGLNLLTGDTIDYANNQPADLVQVIPSLELKLGSRINAKIDHSLRQLDVDGGRLFRANLTQLRLVYHFNVRTLIRGTFQYYKINSDPVLYTGPYQPEPKEETLYSEFLFSYKLNPQTVIFVGSSENRLGLPGTALNAADRTYFVKLGYAWLL